MNNETIQIRYDSIQLSALEMALSEKGQTIEGELQGYLDQLFEKNVHKAVQAFLLNRPAKPPKSPRPRPAKKPANE